MTTIRFIRHAETTNNLNHSKIVGGRSTHIGITEHGEQQCEVAGRRLFYEGYLPDVTASSPALRTMETGRRVCSAAWLQFDPIIMANSRSSLKVTVKAGRAMWCGLSKRWLRMLQNPMNHRLKGGESHHDVQERMLKGVEMLADTCPDGNVLVFGHGLAIRDMVGAINGLSHQEIMGLSTPNVSATQISLGKRGLWQVDYVGRSLLDDRA